VTPSSKKKFTVKSPAYFSGKRKGETFDLPFQVDGGKNAKFTSISFNGARLC